MTVYVRRASILARASVPGSPLALSREQAAEGVFEVELSLVCDAAFARRLRELLAGQPSYPAEMVDEERPLLDGGNEGGDR